MPKLTEPTAALLRSLLAAEASVSNPVDMIASATAEQYGQAVRILGAAPEVDALIVMFNTPLLTRSTDVAAELVAARPELGSDMALLAVFMNREGPPPALREAGIASFSFPENAARALGRSITWQEWRRRPAGRVLRPEVDQGRAAQIAAAGGLRSRDGWLAEADAEALLGAYGIAVARARRVRKARPRPRRPKPSSGARSSSRSPPPSTRAMSAGSGLGWRHRRRPRRRYARSAPTWSRPG